MNHQIILPTKRSVNYLVNYGKLTVKKNGWLANKLISFLLYLKIVKWNIYETETITTISICVDDYIRFVNKERNKIGRDYGNRDLILIMGPRQFQEIVKQEVFVPMVFTWPDKNTALNVCGLITCVLPWIDGVVLVPREYWPIDTKIVEKVVAMTPEMADDERKKQEGIRAANMWNRFMGRTVTESYVDED
jgi:hypothetical protein